MLRHHLAVAVTPATAMQLQHCGTVIVFAFGGKNIDSQLSPAS
jgi:hypothetical protein